MIQVLCRNWSHQLNTLLHEAKQNIILCTPFITQSGVNLIADALTSSSHNKSVSTTIITNISLRAVINGATEPAAVRNLAKQTNSDHIHHVPGLHAKIYIIDNHHAIITSGNLTAGGLIRNYEYGLEIDDPNIITNIRKDILAYARLGATMNDETLDKLTKLTHAVKKAAQVKLDSATSKACLAYENAVTQTENHLLRQRVAGKPIHTIFAQTIEYILKKSGPLPTTQIHQQIAEIHPDLCDNAIDRVIDGIHFGKKWKHAVRTAQQSLKKQNKITLNNGLWLIPSQDQ